MFVCTFRNPLSPNSLWCQVWSQSSQALCIIFHSEHMTSLTCVRTFTSVFTACKCVCVCLTLSAEQVRLPLPLAEVSAEMCVCVCVCEFMQVNRMWNVCFPHWAEHFLMQYVKTCVIPHQRGRKYRWAAAPLAIRPLVLGKLGPVGESFVNQLEACNGWEKQRQDKNRTEISWMHELDLLMKALLDRPEQPVALANTKSEERPCGEHKDPRIWSSMCLLMAELFCQNTVKAYQRPRLWSSTHTRFPTHTLENWETVWAVVFAQTLQFCWAPACLLSQNMAQWFDTIRTLIRGASGGVQCCLYKMPPPPTLTM